MAEALFVGTDFDGTTHLTSEPAPDGSTVELAYEMAIDAHLGPDAVDVFVNDQGGHRSRDPNEIVASLLPQDVDEATVDRFTRKVVESKLEILEPSIGMPLADGTPWPRPTPGFAPLWRAISTAKEAGVLIGAATLSAGHTDFQKKVFSVHGLEYPDIFMTYDVLRAMCPDIPHEDLAKPSPFMLTVAREAWKFGQQVQGREINTIKTFMAGDSNEKDGGLARAANIPFYLINAEDGSLAWACLGGALGFSIETIREIQRG
ncbi:hypothetical protein EKI60_01550 [Candidatus Saccharibacteria bacterium]|nr:MAG: hypothetical protein EKI60_01550 [Candidatus Saccharibacteria bacterium]